ncbi:SPOR domain-containing protein [Stenotrophomonas sp.]|uniref:SPOR domain-containing protein n=1 Tax=Stenotrophomonas sp. TaxID=69392 RepID=UPI0028975C02|nr:SPOR domain-containing protein [Stenotrophomonas sp.]
MLTRALIVVLAILNLGVALWWMLRGDPVPAAPAATTGVAQLQLLPSTGAPPPPATVAAPPTQALDDVTPAPKPTPVATSSAAATEPAVASVTAAPTPTPTPAAVQPPPASAAVPAAVPAPAAAAPAQCVSLGPFADRAAAQAAQAKAGAVLRGARLREVADAGATRYRVLLPAAASREDAQATVKRIMAAGVSDYYIIAQGEETNAIALGQYRNREGAERRMAALSAAGFNARMVASGGDGSAQWWLDATLAEQADASVVRQRSGAAQQRSLDCARVR